MNNGSFLSGAIRELNALMAADGGMFINAALGMGRVMAGISIAAAGVRIMFGTVPDRKALLLRLVVVISLVFAMLNFYNSPIPGMGVSFHGLITNEGIWLSAQIEQGSNDSLNANLNNVMALGSGGDGIMGDIRSVLLIVVVALAQGVLFFVIAWGFIATEVLVLVGPIFATGLLWEWTSRWFWSWLTSLLQYSFYPVIANAYVWVMARFFTDFFVAHPLPWAAGQAASLSLIFLSIGTAFIFGMLKVPSLVSHLFNGSSGDHAFPGLGMLR